jgi:tetratricopeptide (TPR) repeat protein/TolB-like protein
LRAQCADGSPPPCRSATVASAPRRTNPPLDDKTWIVVPFDNLRNGQDIEWLRGASVNLLYLDMSRWRDIRVIDDERVADLLREVPEAKDATKLDLSAGLAVAKRAGAGRLVMGDLLQLGSRTTVTAKVYDVRSGQRLRSVQEAATIQDSVIGLFSKLAQKVLNVAPPAGASLGTIGTTSVAAYQEYMAGVAALNGFRIADARAAFDRALKLDSTFALAHYKQSIAYGWGDSGNPEIRTHAESAARLSAGLPARERALINGHMLQARREYARACDAFEALLRTNPNDVDALYGLGDCHFHDNSLEPIDGDSTRWRFRGNVNQSIRSFQRALELDPTNHLAYQHIVDGYLAEVRSATNCAGGRCTTHAALPIRRGDSLVIEPVVLPHDSARFREQAAEYARTLSRRGNVEAAVTVAERWVTESPNEGRARSAYASALLAAGRIADAYAQLGRVETAVADQMFNAFTNALLRIEIVAKMWGGAEALRLYDSTRASRVVLRGQPGVGAIVSFLGPLFGRMTEYDSLMQANLRQLTGRPAMQRYVSAIPRLVWDVMGDSAVLVERALFEEMRAALGTAAATRQLGATLALAPERAATLPLDTAVVDVIAQPAIAMFLRDTTRLRRAALRLDSASSRALAAFATDSVQTLAAANAYLTLRDSLSALRMTRRMLDSVIPISSLLPRQGGFPYGLFVGRAMVLRADLAAGLGLTDEARLWYKRFLDMWATPAPAYQHVVDRVRRSYAAIGGT